MWKARKPNQEPLKPLTILLWNWKPHLPNLMPWLMGTWLSWWLPYGIPGAPNKKQSSLCKSCFELGSQAFQILWLSSWAHGYPHASHVVLLETNPRAQQASIMLAIELEARSSTSSCLAYVPMALLRCPIWKARKPSQGPCKPLTILCCIWKPGLPKSLA